MELGNPSVHWAIMEGLNHMHDSHWTSRYWGLCLTGKILIYTQEDIGLLLEDRLRSSDFFNVHPNIQRLNLSEMTQIRVKMID